MSSNVHQILFSIYITETILCEISSSRDLELTAAWSMPLWEKQLELLMEVQKIFKYVNIKTNTRTSKKLYYWWQNKHFHIVLVEHLNILKKDLFVKNLLCTSSQVSGSKGDVKC